MNPEPPNPPDETEAVTATALAVSIGSENAHSHKLTAWVSDLPPDRHPVVVYLASLRPGSRRSTRQALKIAAQSLKLELEHLPWHCLRYQHTQAIRAEIATKYAPTTANKILAAVRGVVREARRLGLISAEHASQACEVRNITGSTTVRGRALSAEEIRSLRNACDPTTALGARDRALLACLFGGGLRRSEAAALDRCDVHGADGTDLSVRGKGGKAREVYLAPVYAADLAAWLVVRGDAEGPLLWALRRGGRPIPGRITDQAVLVALRRLAARAGLARGFSPHDARRTFISQLLDEGADIATVARLAGHSQVTTTARYDRRGERAARDAAALIDPNRGE